MDLRSCREYSYQPNYYCSWQDIVSIHNPVKGRPSCVGFAASRGRRCWNPIAAGSVAWAIAMVEGMRGLDHLTYGKLRSVASTMLCHLHKHDEEDVVRDWMQKGTGSFKGCDEYLRGAVHEELERLKMRRAYDEAMQRSSLPHQPRTHESHQRADQQTREEQQYLRMSIRVADSISRPQSQQKPYHSTKQQVPERLSFDASDSNPLSHQQQNPHHGTAQQGQESPSFNVEDPDSPSQQPQIHPHLDTKQLEQESPPLNAEDHNSQTQQQQVPHQDTKQQKQDKCEPEPAQAKKMQIKGQEWPDASSRCICKCNSLDADPDNKHLKLRWPTIFVLCAWWDRCWGAVEKRPGLWGRIVFALVFILFTDAIDGGKTNFQRASKTT